MGTGSFSVVNLGCKVNRADSDRYERILSSFDLSAADMKASDIVVVNTCTVTSTADKKTRKTVRSILRENPGALVVVSGCSAVRDAGLYERMSERVHVVVPVLMDEELPRIIRESGFGSGSAPGAKALLPDPVTLPMSRMGVKIQDGCDNRCTYCVIWQARGPERSISPHTVHEDVERLASQGIREIMLTGINLGRYNSGGLRLEGLLQSLLSMGYPCRYRISSIEPPDVDERLIGLLAESGGLVCRHLHIPLQSGSDRVLHDMGRKYSMEGYHSLIDDIRRAIPGVSISTDIISGFPGETDSDHQANREALASCGFSKVHVFPYSKREGTIAAERRDQVPAEVKALRARELRELASNLRRDDLAQRRGTSEWAVVESRASCTTESYHEVKPPDGADIGALVEVTL